MKTIFRSLLKIIKMSGVMRQLIFISVFLFTISLFSIEFDLKPVTDNNEIIANWTIVLAIATTILAFTSVLLAYYAFKEGKRNKTINKFNLYIELMKLLDNTHKEREYISNLLKNDISTKYDESDMKLNDKAEQIIRDWDKIGLMWENKIIPNDLIYYYYSQSIVSSFIYFSEKLKNDREIYKKASLRDKFQKLFVFCDEYRHKHKGSELHDKLYEI